MSTIKITDQFGLDVDVKTDILSSLEKYASNLSKLSLTNLNLQSIADLTLANPSITSLHAGLNFDQPVDIGAGGVTLQVDAGLKGTMDIYVPPTGGGSLFQQDLYGETIPVAAAERYVSIGIGATAGPDIGATPVLRQALFEVLDDGGGPLELGEEFVDGDLTLVKGRHDRVELVGRLVPLAHAPSFSRTRATKAPSLTRTRTSSPAAISPRDFTTTPSALVTTDHPCAKRRAGS